MNIVSCSKRRVVGNHLTYPINDFTIAIRQLCLVRVCSKSVNQLPFASKMNCSSLSSVPDNYNCTITIMELH